MTLAPSYVGARQRAAARERVRSALPGTVHELAARAELNWHQAAGHVAILRARGLAVATERVRRGPRGGRTAETVWTVADG